MLPRFNRTLLTPLVLLLAFIPAPAQKPELVLQTGHAGSISTIVFSPDGHLLASAGNDNAVKLWDVATGRELRSLSERMFDTKDRKIGMVDSIAFSPDGRLLASSHSSAVAKLWEVETGRELRRLDGAQGAVAFTPDGLWLAIMMADKTNLWNVATGQLRPVPLAQTTGYDAVFSPNGRLLALTDLNEVTLWHTDTGRKVRTLAGASRPAVFSPDGRTLATGMELDGGGPPDTRILLWDVATGRLTRDLRSPSFVITSLAFSPDGRVIAAGDKDQTVSLWSMATGRRLRQLEGHGDEVNTVAFSPDGRLLASAGNDRNILLWDAKTGRKAGVLTSVSGGISDLAFSTDGRHIALASGSAVSLWDVAAGNGPQSLVGHTGRVQHVLFSPDGRFLVSGPGDGPTFGGEDKTTILWDVAARKKLRSLVAFTEWNQIIGFGPESSLLGFVGLDQGVPITFDKDVISIRFFDSDTGRRHYIIPEATKPVALSADGRVLVYTKSTAVKGSDVNGGRELTFWDVAGRRKLRSLPMQIASNDSILFSPDMRLLVLTGYEQPTKVLDAETGRVLYTMPNHGDKASVRFSADGRRLLTGGLDQTAKVWDSATGQLLATLTGHTSAVSAVTFSPDGKLIVTGSEDGSLRVWEAQTGDELVTLIKLNGDDWLAVTPDGLFDGSPAAWNQLLWRFSPRLHDIAPVEIFFTEFFYPGLLADIISGKRPKAAQSIAQRDRRQPVVKLTLAEGQSRTAPVSQRNVTVRLSVSESPADQAHATGSGTQDVRLFRNGSLVRAWHGDVLKAQPSAVLEATVPIVAGENIFTAYAFNRDNIKSADATLLIAGAASLARKGVAYVLVVGINQYANPQYDLKYAVADAEAFGAEIKRQQEQLGQYGRVEVVSVFDGQATKQNVLSQLTALAAKVQPEDLVIIFFAGHGTAQQNRFYLIPHDLGYTGARTALDQTSLNALLTHSISDQELERVFEQADVGRLVLVVDACNSGQALEAEERRRGPMNSKGLAQLAYEKGMYILTAAQSFQAAQEVAQVGHGLLTYALVEEGLKQAAADGEPKDGTVLAREWLDYATNRVPEMQIDKMRQARDAGLNLAFAEEERGLDFRRRSGQQPRVFYRRELESRQLVIAKPARPPVR